MQTNFIRAYIFLLCT